MKRKITVFLLTLLVMMSIPVFAVPGYIKNTVSTTQSASRLYYITDVYGILTDEQNAQMEAEAERISLQYGCGIYVVAVDDYQNYGSGGVFDVAAEIYHEYTLGEGEGRNGIILLLSMKARDYAIFVYGADAEYAFNEYGLVKLEDEFLDDFAQNRWFDGVSDYIDTCENYLELAKEGKPVSKSKGPAIAIVVAGSMVIALIVCLVMNSGMKNVSKQVSAVQYISGDGLQLSKERDIYSHTTETRTKIEKESSKSESGSGGSGRSGKF